ncbi:MAG TPA: NAD-binding protein, partial [Micromonosporaceae bacterium]|nr:NAD-binding protein [Micromonosporaceae bacterium]
MTEPWRNLTRRSVTRLRLRSNGEDRPHYVVCGHDPLTVQLVHELLREGVRVTVIVSGRRPPDGPDIRSIRGIRVIKADRLDENTFRAAGLQGAKGVALMLQDDVANIHAALCAHEAAP